jgi:hypothetical protein
MTASSRLPMLLEFPLLVGHPSGGLERLRLDRQFLAVAYLCADWLWD